MKGSSSKQHSGRVRVAFDVSKDVASQIQQLVAGSWKGLRDLGVVSIQLDKEQLMCDKATGLCTEVPEIQSAELKQYSYAFNGYTESKPVVEASCSRRSRGGRRGRGSGSRGTRQKRYSDPSAYPFASNELCSNAVSAASAVHDETVCRNIGITSQRINHGKEAAGLISSERVLFNVSSSELSNHLSSNIAFGGVSLSMECRAVSTKTPFIVNKPCEVVSAITPNTLQSHDLPPPSTPFVPKRRKRRKPAVGGLETMSAKAPSYVAVTCVDNALLPLHETVSYCTDRRFQLNGHYPQQVESPMFRHYTVNNAHLASLSIAGSPSPVNVANCVKLPSGSRMLLDSSLSLPSSTGWSRTPTAELKDIGTESVQSSVQAGGSQPSQTSLGLNVSCPSCGQCGQLHQPASPEASSPKLLDRFSQGTPDSTHCSPETFDVCAGTGAETNVVSCAEHFCTSANGQLQEDLLPPNFCSGISTFSSAIRTQPTETQTSLSSEISTSDSLAPVLKPPETVSFCSVDMIENVNCSVSSVTAAASVCSSPTSVNCIVQSDMVDINSLPVSNSSVVKKQKPDVMNGYCRMSDYSPAETWHTSHPLAQSAAMQTINKSSVCLSSDVINIKCDFQPAADRFSITEPSPNKEAQQLADAPRSANMQSPHEFEHCGSIIEVSEAVTGRYNILLFQTILSI